MTTTDTTGGNETTPPPPPPAPAVVEADPDWIDTHYRGDNGDDVEKR